MNQVDDEKKVKAVARCLAKLDGGHIGASEWRESLRAGEYRKRAEAVLKTIDNVDAGVLSGGLPYE